MAFKKETPLYIQEAEKGAVFDKFAYKGVRLPFWSK